MYTQRRLVKPVRDLRTVSSECSVMKSMRCCVPDCTLLANQSNLKHVAFYGIKPMWYKPIIEFIVTTQAWAPKNAKLRSNVICGKHYRLCGIKDLSQSTVFYFPRLRVSISHYSRKPFNFRALYNNDELAVSHEEIFPPTIGEKPIDLSRQKKIAPPRAMTRHVDHNYAITPQYVRFLQHEYEACVEEHKKVSKSAHEQIEKQKAEIQRLKDINHDLLKTNLNQSTSACPLRSIPENEQLLKFYTGFTKRENFESFMEVLRPKYMEKRRRENADMRMVPQLILVLSRLRLGLMHNDLAYRFNISLTTVLKIWMFWIKLLTEVIVASCECDQDNHKVIVECYETLFETSQDNKTGRTYGRARALIELDSTGLVVNTSDLFPSYVTNEQIIKSWNKAKQSQKRNDSNTTRCMKERDRFIDLQTHVKKILGFLKSYKILKGTFPSSVTSVKQLNVYWKICCFLVNYTCPELIR